VLAVMTIFERAADQLIFWLPMYSEAKVALVVYLWHPRTQGAIFVYDTFLQPFLQVRRMASRSGASGEH
jgi:receptor expression-enhancing protein 1/2/3/4